MTRTNWWDNDRATQRHLGESFSGEGIPLVLKSLKDRDCTTTGRVRGTPRFPIEEFLEKLQKKGVIPYYKHGCTVRCAGPGELVYWMVNSRNVIELSWTASSVVYGEELRELVSAWLETVPEEVRVPPVYGFSFEHGSYIVREIGHLRDTFIDGNYTSEVAVKYRNVITELQKPEPAGRLVLVEGEPGTGKTRMIRALIGSLMETSKCIVVPPSLMDRLSGPEFTLCLIQQREADKSLTLILEDADDCLIAREKNTAAKASLSALLNLSDGIMGATLDLRVVATTNQELGSIDRAILRPGRLLERIHVGPLSGGQATEVYKRLSGGVERTLVSQGEVHPFPYRQPTTLAQVYEDVRTHAPTSS